MMYDLMGISKEQLQENLKQAQEKVATYTENSIDEARAKWHDAREMLQSLQLSTNYELRAAAVQVEAEAKKNLDDALQHAGPMAAAKRARELTESQAAEHKKQEDEAQKQHSEQEKARYRELAKSRYLAAGGTLDQFNHAFADLWSKELERRTLTAQDTTSEKLSARYTSMRV